MNADWIDVSMPLHEGMTRWPGDPAFEIVPCGRIAEGTGANTSQMTLSTHAGTHVDAPWHFVESGKRVHELDQALFFGEARVVDVPDTATVTADDLGKEPLPARMLVRTRNSAAPLDAPFNERYTALDPSAAQRLVDEGVRLVGVDYLSVAPFHEPALSLIHRILLENDILVVEGLRLAAAAPGPCRFVVLPMPVAEADGAPCRAFLRPA